MKMGSNQGYDHFAMGSFTSSKSVVSNLGSKAAYSSSNMSRPLMSGNSFTNKYMAPNFKTGAFNRSQVKMQMNPGSVPGYRNSQMNSLLGSQYTIKQFG